MESRTPTANPEAGTTMMVAAALSRATEVLGNQDVAMRWMGTPIRALDYATPISLLNHLVGLEAVERVLGRLEHGVL